MVLICWKIWNFKTVNNIKTLREWHLQTENLVNMEGHIIAKKIFPMNWLYLSMRPLLCSFYNGLHVWNPTLYSLIYPYNILLKPNSFLPSTLWKTRPILMALQLQLRIFLCSIYLKNKPLPLHGQLSSYFSKSNTLLKAEVFETVCTRLYTFMYVK